ncbi:LysR substrate-binding domain-containing protein [Streptomyces sp. Edi4]|uniref:LysR family transcriptional regulator n=1 Tax=Streptomyces sp. Edi4 TaxID=3162527 RepID=UPI0033062215
MLDVRRILLFTEVARRGSVTATARLSSYTPSAVSQQVSRLEAEAGQPLLERQVPSGVSRSLTRDAPWPSAERIERELTAAENELANFAGLRAGILRIGTFPTVGASLLPRAVIAFRKAHPDVRLTVRSARIAGLWAMLENREIEMSLMWDYDWNRIDREDIVVTSLVDDPRPSSSARTTPSPAALRPPSPTSRTTPGSPRAENHPVAEALARSCHTAGFKPQIAYEAHDYQEAQAMVAAGIGVALAPTLALEGTRGGVQQGAPATATPRPGTPHPSGPHGRPRPHPRRWGLRGLPARQRYDRHVVMTWPEPMPETRPEANSPRRPRTALTPDSPTPRLPAGARVLRLGYLAVTHAFAVLRLLPMSDRGEDTKIAAASHDQLMVLARLGEDRGRFTPSDRAYLTALLYRLPRDVLRRPARDPSAWHAR